MTGHDPDDLLTAEQVAAAHGVDVGTIYVRRNRGTMPPPDEIIGKSLMRWKWRTVEGLTFRRAIGRPQA